MEKLVTVKEGSVKKSLLLRLVDLLVCLVLGHEFTYGSKQGIHSEIVLSDGRTRDPHQIYCARCDNDFKQQ